MCASSSRWSLSLISRPGGHSLTSRPDGHFHFHWFPNQMVIFIDFQTKWSFSLSLISRPDGHCHWFPDHIYWDSHCHWFLDQMVTFTFTDFQTRWSLSLTAPVPQLFHCPFFSHTSRLPLFLKSHWMTISSRSFHQPFWTSDYECYFWHCVSGHEMMNPGNKWFLSLFIFSYKLLYNNFHLNSYSNQYRTYLVGQKASGVWGLGGSSFVCFVVVVKDWDPMIYILK